MSEDEVRPDSTVIGDVASPPFVRLPDPARLFIDRTQRLRVLAARSAIAPYLLFLAGLTEYQYRIQDGLPEPEMPDETVQARARAHAMPPLARAGFRPDAAFRATLAALVDTAGDIPQMPAARAALERVRAADGRTHEAMVGAVLATAIPAETLAEHVYVAAALQVHFARCAARLDGEALVPVGDGACPSCGGPPASSLVVGWRGAHGTRFCACALCGTFWHTVRIKCTLCGSTKGVGYQEVEGEGGTIKAETCDACRSYVKVLYQVKDADLEPVADDAASLGLDLLMQGGPYRRGGFNPFLLGY
ncbi:formate dehydrogenase accessory protein FdhE [Chelatococcus reniformis]|uniref:Protein FdhE homolog n=1 Tax=Chelatococcus reniformis TaxID=1494448 RepID=A0A916UJL7_9HYPH|nr:formate dehydrogenase accessory protein FdhE [Chelatococcus reniformis]GGC75368.1 protein FdhE [Chelatococcus reniformis]